MQGNKGSPVNSATECGWFICQLFCAEEQAQVLPWLSFERKKATPGKRQRGGSFSNCFSGHSGSTRGNCSPSMSSEDHPFSFPLPWGWFSTYPQEPVHQKRSNPNHKHQADSLSLRWDPAFNSGAIMMDIRRESAFTETERRRESA